MWRYEATSPGEDLKCSANSTKGSELGLGSNPTLKFSGQILTAHSAMIGWQIHLNFIPYLNESPYTLSSYRLIIMNIKR